VAKERNQILREIAAGKKSNFMKQRLGTIMEAITLRTGDEDFTEALTDNYLKMKIEGKWPANRWVAVEVKSIVSGEQCLIGRCTADSCGPERIDQTILMEPLGKY
jgi:tRNA A37 methylthiotransferase MiaB